MNLRMREASQKTGGNRSLGNGAADRIDDEDLAQPLADETAAASRKGSLGEEQFRERGELGLGSKVEDDFPRKRVDQRVAATAEIEATAPMAPNTRCPVKSSSIIDRNMKMAMNS